MSEESASDPTPGLGVLLLGLALPLFLGLWGLQTPWGWETEGDHRTETRRGLFCYYESGTRLVGCIAREESHWRPIGLTATAAVTGGWIALIVLTWNWPRPRGSGVGLRPQRGHRQ